MLSLLMVQLVKILMCFSMVRSSLTTEKPTFLNKHQIYSISLYEFFRGILFKGSDFWAFIPFETQAQVV